MFLIWNVVSFVLHKKDFDKMVHPAYFLKRRNNVFYCGIKIGCKYNGEIQEINK